MSILYFTLILIFLIYWRTRMIKWGRHKNFLLEKVTVKKGKVIERVYLKRNGKKLKVKAQFWI